MTEPFDAELSRAVKESAAKSLQGFEFTPEMRAKVLARIQAEESEEPPKPAVQPVRRLHPAPLLRPLSWAALAAAAVLIAVNMGNFGFSQASKQSAPMGQASAAQSAAANERKTASAASEKPVATLQAPVESLPPAGAKATAEVQGAVASGMDASTAAADSHTSTASASVAAAQIPKAGTPVLSLRVPAGDGGEVAALGGPRGKATSGGIMGIAAAPPAKVSLKAAPGLAVEVSEGGVRGLGQGGEQLWDQRLEGVQLDSALAVAPDGRSAVTAGSRVYQLGKDGRAIKLELPHPATGLAWAPDGRLAIASDTVVGIYRDGALVYTVKAWKDPDIAFTTDGKLAVWSRADRAVFLYDAGGALITRTSVEPEGQGIAAADGGVLVAGGQALSSDGRLLWRAPMQTEGATSLPGAGIVVAWDSLTVLALQARDGQEVWKASLEGGQDESLRKVVTAPDGNYVAVLGQTSHGGAVWVISRTGELVRAQRIEEMPLDAAFVDGGLVVLLSHSEMFVELP